MGGIGELLLLDEGIVVQPVEELRAVGADDLSLRIVDVRVDEAGHDKAAGMVVDRHAWRRACKHLARLSYRFDTSVRDENRTVLEIDLRRDPAASGSSEKVRMRPRMTRALALKTECP